MQCQCVKRMRAAFHKRGRLQDLFACSISLYGFKVISFERVLEGFAIIYFLCTLLNIGYLISLKRAPSNPISNL